MAYTDLTDEQKASIQALSTFMRGLSSEWAKLLEKSQAVAAYYSGNVETDIAGLQGSDLIPQTTGFAGAEAMTKDQFTTLAGYFIVVSNPADAASGSYNTPYHRALYAIACGPENVS